jgi:hypothetical protein
MDDPVKEYLRRIGAKGGKAGKGASKVRGDSDYYRRLVKKRRTKKKARKRGGGR